jgi:hypothetical protein
MNAGCMLMACLVEGINLEAVLTLKMEEKICNSLRRYFKIKGIHYKGTAVDYVLEKIQKEMKL